jgi:hypothetical protein
MRRSGFKRKKYEDVIKSGYIGEYEGEKIYNNEDNPKRKFVFNKPKKKLKKQSKQKISVIQRKLWKIIKQIVRKKDPNVCYTCGQTNLAGINHQSGHMWAKASLGAYMKYDLRLIRPQCFRCNINYGGLGAEFYARMLREIGQEEMEKLQKDRQVTVNAYDHYLKLIDEYTKLL